MFLDCVIGRRGLTIPLPPSILTKNIILKPNIKKGKAIFMPYVSAKVRWGSTDTKYWEEPVNVVFIELFHISQGRTRSMRYSSK